MRDVKGPVTMEISIQKHTFEYGCIENHCTFMSVYPPPFIPPIHPSMPLLIFKLIDKRTYTCRKKNEIGIFFPLRDN